MGSMRKITARKILFVCCFVILSIFISTLFSFSEEDRKIQLKRIHDLITNQANIEACKKPNLPVDAPEIMKFIKHVPPINCSSAGTNWVVCKDSKCEIQKSIIKKYGKVKCSFTDLIRKDDFYLADGKTTETYNSYDLRASDVVRIYCKSSKGAVWKGTLTGIRIDDKLRSTSGWNFISPNATKLNVLMFGFDSLSRNTFIRKLPKSYKYLIEVLGGHVLQSYNIVGDGTPQALIPILTGKTELELPDTRKRITNTDYVDIYPFIWKDYKKAGYVTGFLEDVPNLGTFTYRLRGFKKSPTDHYMRPYYIAASKEWYKGPKLCAGDIPRHKVMMNHIMHFFSAYSGMPKFLFGFHGELSHDSYNLIGAADNDLLEFLKNMHESGALTDTVLILMADHGHRFADIRSTIQGKQEERLPFFSFTFPQMFKEQYKNAYNNFVNNVERLTTPFDIYSTLKSLLNLNDTGPADLKQRSLSLFTQISSERSCAHAFIEPHWCACLQWEKVPLENSIVIKLQNTLLNTINNYTSTHRNLCANLAVSETNWVLKMRPNENLVKFNKNADTDGFVADMSSKMVVKSDTYQIQVKLTPGDSLFEASIAHNIVTDTLHLRISDISRINMYGNQDDCIENDFPNLRKYCFCKE